MKKVVAIVLVVGSVGYLCMSQRQLGASMTHAAEPRPGQPPVRVIRFSDYTWKVKSSQGRVGPGPNYFSESSDNVSMDDRGRLRLRITQRDGRWNCAEVISERSFGYGTYRFYLETPAEKIDRNAVLGLFTWSDEPDYSHREIDFLEISRWGQANNQNAQFVVQPYTRRQNIHRWQIPTGVAETTFLGTWSRDRVLFQAWRGHSAAPPDAQSILQEWSFSQRVPQAGGENARMNLWLMNPRGPADGKEVEVIITNFEFTPIP